MGVPLDREVRSLEHFMNFKRLLEKEIDSNIYGLKTNRGGEFTFECFNEFCKTNGIGRQLTTAYTPEQNGVAER